jgi:hypothetical protein
LARAASIISCNDLVEFDGATKTKGEGRQESHRLEVGARVVGHVPEKAGVDRHLARRAEQDRVAIRRRLGDARGADHAGGAGLVLDDDRLPEHVGQARGHRAPGDVRPAPRRIGNDQLHRLGGIAVRARPGGGRRGKCEKECREGIATREGTLGMFARHARPYPGNR